MTLIINLIDISYINAVVLNTSITDITSLRHCKINTKFSEPPRPGSYLFSTLRSNKTIRAKEKEGSWLRLADILNFA